MGNQEVLTFRGAREPRQAEAVGGAGPTLDHPDGGVKDEYAGAIAKDSLTLPPQCARASAHPCAHTQSTSLCLHTFSSVLRPCTHFGAVAARGRTPEMQITHHYFDAFLQVAHTSKASGSATHAFSSCTASRQHLSVCAAVHQVAEGAVELAQPAAAYESPDARTATHVLWSAAAARYRCVHRAMTS